MPTGLRLFFQYAWPCAGGRLNSGLISQEDFNELKLLVETSGEPTISLLQRCFPDAMKDKTEFDRDHQADSDPWSKQNVGAYWHQHQGSSGDCATKIATVCSEGSDVIHVICGDTPMYVTNIWRINLQIGDQVYLHWQSISEKFE